jgi:DNA-binding CsgD family transcriptional regulator
MPELTSERIPHLALDLVDFVYAAAETPRAWRDFLAELADACGGDVALTMAFESPGVRPGSQSYASGLDEGEEQREVYARHAARGLPWDAFGPDVFLGRFAFASEVVPTERIADTDTYRDWMEPQGLAAAAPIRHVIASENRVPLATIAIFQKKNGPPLTPEMCALGDLLVPHLAAACRLHAALHENAALAEALDRIPMGVVLLDSTRRPVLSNRTARSILEQHDGFSIDPSGPHAQRPSDEAALQQTLRAALEEDGEKPRPQSHFIAISRPSGRRAYPLMVSHLLSAIGDSALHDAVAVLFISDLEGRSLGRTGLLRDLYDLTRAEAELVDLLCDGIPIDEAARRRGVTTNTARSQLKQVFSKTETSRQADLVRLVMAGIAPIRDD